MSRVIPESEKRITCPYGNGHGGVDLGWRDDESQNIVRAHSDGVVVAVVKNCNETYSSGGSYGNYVMIKHPDGYYTLYAHLMYGTVKVNVGDYVKKDQEIGVIGNTGYSKGRHLHFEVRDPNNIKINPTPYLTKDLPNTPSPSPSPEPDCTGPITYQVYANGWLPEVYKCDGTPEGYAGLGNIPISAVRAKPKYGDIFLQSHTKNGVWLEEVSSKNYSDGSPNSYAGVIGTPMDMIKIRSTKGFVSYRVKTLEDGWLPWVDSRTTTGPNSYAGIPGHTIIGIQMK